MKEMMYGFQYTQHYIHHLAHMDMGKVMHLMMLVIT